jgi:copper chaperone CopZ
VKKTVFLIVMTLQVLLVQAQFSKANLQATGLTCALCSNAINKALKQLPFVETVKADIKNSSFSIVFRQGMGVKPDAIRDAVEGAGFFVGGLQLTGSFNNLNTGPDGIIRLGTNWFRFLNSSNKALNGEVTFTLQDKSFLTAKAFKKISSTVKIPSLSTGKAEADQVKAGVKKGERIYHVTI